ncbi:hypothetical protein V8C86DRAFT_343890 [Haematococcus lacustris]
MVLPSGERLRHPHPIVDRNRLLGPQWPRSTLPPAPPSSGPHPQEAQPQTLQATQHALFTLLRERLEQYSTTPMMAPPWGSFARGGPPPSHMVRGPAHAHAQVQHREICRPHGLYGAHPLEPWWRGRSSGPFCSTGGEEELKTNEWVVGPVSQRVCCTAIMRSGRRQQGNQWSDAVVPHAAPVVPRISPSPYPAATLLGSKAGSKFMHPAWNPPCLGSVLGCMCLP